MPERLTIREYIWKLHTGHQARDENTNKSIKIKYTMLGRSIIIGKEENLSPAIVEKQVLLLDVAKFIVKSATCFLYADRTAQWEFLSHA